MKKILDIEDSELKKRFWSKVDKTGSCWNWTGNVNSSGYGTIKINGKNYTTHRLSFILFNNYIPSSKKDIMHLCDNKKCVNPEHLKEGTRLDNILDFISKGGNYGRSGEKNHLSKLTDVQYSKIKERIKSGESVNSLSKEYKVSHQSLFERIKREA